MGEWADIAVSQGRHDSELFGRDNGWVTVNILSTYGSYGHHWGSIGSGSWWEFLHSLDKDYFLKKVMKQSDMWEFSSDKTLECMRQHVIEYRKDCSIAKEEARAGWDVIGKIKEALIWEPDTADTFRNYMIDDDFWSQDFYEFFRHEYSSSANGLWERIWQPFTMVVSSSEELQNAVN